MLVSFLREKNIRRVVTSLEVSGIHGLSCQRVWRVKGVCEVEMQRVRLSVDHKGGVKFEPLPTAGLLSSDPKTADSEDENYITPEDMKVHLLCGVPMCARARGAPLWSFHAFAAVVHLGFTAAAIACSFMMSNGFDGGCLHIWRQQFVFTRQGNETVCGYEDFKDEAGSGDSDSSRVIAVLVPTDSKVHIGAATAAFFGLSALFHLTWVINWKCGRTLYVWLSRGFAPLRWIEYSFSAPLQFLTLLLIVGIRTESEVLAYATLISTTMSFGYLAELHAAGWQDGANAGKKAVWRSGSGGKSVRDKLWRLHPHVLGFLPYIVAWVLLFRFFAQTMDDVKSAFPDNPSSDVIQPFIYTALSLTCATFSIFTFVQWIYLTRDTPRDFWESEAIYCILSMTSKLILGGILLGNVIRENVQAEESAVGPERALHLYNNESASSGP